MFCFTPGNSVLCIEIHDSIHDEFGLMTDQKSNFGSTIMIYGVEKIYENVFEELLV